MSGFCIDGFWIDGFWIDGLLASPLRTTAAGQAAGQRVPAPGAAISATSTRIVAAGLLEVAKTLRATLENAGTDTSITRQRRRARRRTAGNDAVPPGGWFAIVSR